MGDSILGSITFPPWYTFFLTPHDVCGESYAATAYSAPTNAKASSKVNEDFSSPLIVRQVFTDFHLTRLASSTPFTLPIYTFQPHISNNFLYSFKKGDCNVCTVCFSYTPFYSFKDYHFIRSVRSVILSNRYNLVVRTGFEPVWYPQIPFTCVHYLTRFP